MIPWLLSLSCSHAGPYVRVLDPPRHVPDPQVPGHHRQSHLPRRQPNAGPESSKEVGDSETPPSSASSG